MHTKRRTTNISKPTVANVDHSQRLLSRPARLSFVRATRARGHGGAEIIDSRVLCTYGELRLWAAPLGLEEAGLCGRGLALTNLFFAAPSDRKFFQHDLSDGVGVYTDALLIHPRVADGRRADAFGLEAGDVLVGVVRDVGTVMVHAGQDEVVLIGPGRGVGKCQGLEASDDDKGELHLVELDVKPKRVLSSAKWAGGLQGIERVCRRETKVWSSNKSIFNSKRAGIHELKITIPRKTLSGDMEAKDPFCVRHWGGSSLRLERPEHDGAHGCPFPRAGRRGCRLCHQSEWSGASHPRADYKEELGASRRGGTSTYEPELKAITDLGFATRHWWSGLVWSGPRAEG